MRLDRLLDELRSAGLPVAASEVAVDPDSAADAAGRLGFPVVLKACGLDHKSDLGGVVTGLENRKSVLGAARKLERDLGEAANILLVQRHIRGTEVLIGARREPGIGTVIMVGAGGVLAELLGDSAASLLPLPPGGGHALLERLRTYPILTGYRGREVCDVGALVELVEKIAAYVDAWDGLEELDLNPVIAGKPGEGVSIVDARVVTTEKRTGSVDGLESIDLTPLFNPGHVVVVGVSDDSSKTGSRIFRNLLRHGFEGRIDPVHVDGGEIHGYKRYRNLEEVPGVPDLVSIAVPASAVEDVVESAGRIGVGAVIVHGSGFAETGEDGRALQNRIAEKLASARIAFAGPNDMGIVSPPNSLAASLSGGLDLPLVSGSIALVSSSGALGSCLATRLMGNQYGLSRWIHLGNEGGLDAGAYMSWLARDNETTVVGLLMESMSAGPRFVKATRELLAASKTVFVYNMARTTEGQASVTTHTGALLGSQGLREAVLERSGVVSVPTLRALEDVLMLASTTSIPTGNRLAAITASGGACTIIADEAESAGIALAQLTESMSEQIKVHVPGFAAVRNPIDLTAQLLSDHATFAKVLDVLAEKSVFDILLVQLTTNADPGAEAIARAVIECRRRVGIPIIVSRYGATGLAPRALAIYSDARIPVMDAPDRAMQAVSALVRAGNSLRISRDS